MQALELELLRAIWTHLQGDWNAEGSLNAWRLSNNSRQAALRATCRAMRDATNGFISALDMKAAPELPAMRAQLARFPCKATLKTLRIHWPAAWPHLLPSFMHENSSRMQSVTKIQLSGDLVIGYGEVASIADTCPNLQSLVICEAAIAGPAFQPLSRLTSFRELHLEQCWAVGAAVSVLSCLPNLPSLQRLTIAYGKFCGDSSAENFEWPEMLPFLQRMPELQYLRFVHHQRKELPELVLADLVPMTKLEHLNFWTHCQVNVSGPRSVACLTSLRKLQAPCVLEDSDVIRTLAALPGLTELEVVSICPDEDLSMTPCNWKLLTMERAPPLREACWLPLRPVAIGGPTVRFALVDSTFTHDVGIFWTLTVADGHERACAMLHAAATAFAACIPPEHALRLGVGWDSLEGVPDEAWAATLRALAPFDHHRTDLTLPGHGLMLGLMSCRERFLRQSGHWRFSNEQLQVIAETLPYLERLTVRLDKHAPVAPGSVKFAIAAVDSLPKLRQVSFWDMTYYTSPEFETQLLSFARSCAASGRNLRIVYDGDAGWGYSSTRDKLKAWNRELRRVAAPGCTVEIVN